MRDSETYRQRSITVWADSAAGSIRLELEQDIDRPADISLEIGGRRALVPTGGTDNGERFDLAGLDAVDQLIELLVEARDRARKEWLAL